MVTMADGRQDARDVRRPPEVIGAPGRPTLAGRLPAATERGPWVRRVRTTRPRAGRLAGTEGAQGRQVVAAAVVRVARDHGSLASTEPGTGAFGGRVTVQTVTAGAPTARTARPPRDQQGAA